MLKFTRWRFSAQKDPFIKMLGPEFVNNKEEILKKYPNVDGKINFKINPRFCK
jgi:hypothetical protein